MCLQLNLGPTRWKVRTNICKLSSGLHKCAMTHMHPSYIKIIMKFKNFMKAKLSNYLVGLLFSMWVFETTTEKPSVITPLKPNAIYLFMKLSFSPCIFLPLGTFKGPSICCSMSWGMILLCCLEVVESDWAGIPTPVWWRVHLKVSPGFALLICEINTGSSL